MSKEKGSLLDNDHCVDHKKLQGLDLIFTKVSQSAKYPIFLNTISAALSWGAGGMLIFMGNILAASPGNSSKL